MNIRQLKSTLILSLSLLSCGIIGHAQNPAEKGLATINRNQLESQLTFLSSDWFEGREATTKGAFMAADYLASLYQTAGVKPFGDSYFQTVPLTVASAPKNANITIKSKSGSSTFSFPEHFRAERTLNSYSIKGRLVWGGFGLKNDAFNELIKDCKNNIVIRIKGLPKIENENSPLAKTLASKNNNGWLGIKSSALNESGALAILEYDLNNPYLEQSLDEDPTQKQTAKGEKELNKRSSGIYKKSLFLPGNKKYDPYYYLISKSVIETLIPDFENQLKNYIAHLQNNKVTPVKTATHEQVELNTEANIEYKKCQNVIAMIKGSEYPDEVIVVGGHYDHLGSYNGYIWNGADDNGSGAIGTVAIARAFAATGIQPKRTVIFANWTAEERGLFGSRHFVNTYKDIAKVKYYHNYDMVGRSNNPEEPDMKVKLLYTQSWKAAEDLCRQYNSEYKLGLNFDYRPWDNPTGGSDNAPFAQKGIPIYWFHTDGHPEYHMPGDHAHLIDWGKFEAIVKTSFLSLWHLANE